MGWQRAGLDFATEQQWQWINSLWNTTRPLFCPWTIYNNTLGVQDIHTYTTIYKMISKDLLYSPGSSTQCSVITYRGKGSRKDGCTYNWITLLYTWKASLVAQLVNNPPAMQETLVWFLGWEDPLEKWLATHSSILGLPLWLNWWRICLQCRRPWFDSWVGKILWRRDRLPTPVF